MLYQPKTCCCGCSLKSGAQIIGYFQIILNTILFLIFSVTAIYSDHIAADLFNHPDDQEFISYIIFSSSCIFLILISIAIFFAIFLIVGAKKNRRKCLMAWLVYAWLKLIVIIGASIIIGYNIPEILIQNIIFTVIIIGFFFYSILIVNSFHTNIYTQFA